MRFVGLYVCAALVVVLGVAEHAAGQQAPPLPPNVQRDCAAGDHDFQCTETLTYSYVGNFYIEDVVQDSKKIANTSYGELRYRDHQLKIFNKFPPRSALRRAILHDQVNLDHDGKTRTYHEVVLEYHLGQRNYSERCTRSDEDGGDVRVSAIYEIKDAQNKPLEEYEITTAVKGGPDLDYLKLVITAAGQDLKKVDPFPDRTRCKQTTFPFTLARDPNLAPPP